MKIAPEVRAEAAKGVPVIIKGLMDPRAIAVARQVADWPSYSSLWQPGRQQTGYEKLDLRHLIANAGIGDRWAPTHEGLHLLEVVGLKCREALDVRDEKWDLYLLRYRDYSYIPPHRDEAGLFGLRHVRVNALVRQCASGGMLRLGDRPVRLDVGDGLFFYPDEVEHSVDTVVGERLVLTCGAWVPA